MRLRAWIGALFGRSDSGQGRRASPEAPRPWHDEIAHVTLPRLLLSEAGEVLGGAVPAEGALDLLYDLFEDAGVRHGLGFDEAMDAADQSRFLRRTGDGVVVAAIAMPSPAVAGEAHFVGLAAHPGEEPRCFALDHAEDGTTLVEITADGLRIPLGPGPAAEPDAFVSAIASTH